VSPLITEATIAGAWPTCTSVVTSSVEPSATSPKPPWLEPVVHATRPVATSKATMQPLTAKASWPCVPEREPRSADQTGVAAPRASNPSELAAPARGQLGPGGELELGRAAEGMVEAQAAPRRPAARAMGNLTALTRLRAAS